MITSLTRRVRGRLQSELASRQAQLRLSRLEVAARQTGSPSERALVWLRGHELESGGIRVHSHHRRAYQEVTGYLIPTLLQWGETDFAIRCTQWLMRVQGADGSFVDPDAGRPYIFDTGQALRGLLAMAEVAGPHASQALEAARSAANYLISQTVEQGRKGFVRSYEGEALIDDGILLYVLPPLLKAAPHCEGTVEMVAHNCVNFYTQQDLQKQVGSLTHFLAYQIEAYIELGMSQRAFTVLGELERLQTETGAVRAVDGSDWVCTPGLAQLAVCWLKVGRLEPARRALSWLEAHQNASGGFLGSYGEGATYFPRFEPSWAPKYFLDAQFLMKQTDSR